MSEQQDNLDKAITALEVSQTAQLARVGDELAALRLQVAAGQPVDLSSELARIQALTVKEDAEEAAPAAAPEAPAAPSA